MKLIEFYKDEVLVECEECKSTFKSPFKLIELDEFYYIVKIDYKYCPYCNKLLNCNKGEIKNEN